MKRRWLLYCTALLAFFLGACTAARPSDNKQGLQLYFLSTKEAGPAIVAQPFPDDTDATPEGMIQALLAGPTEDGLRSPFPKGLSLRGCTLKDGHLTVDFSEQYGGLTDVSLTLADYCVVLTLCQLGQVDSVGITVSGRPLSYRSHQTLTLEDAVLATQ